MGFARRVWLVGTALTAVPVVMTGGAAILAARMTLGSSPEAAPALRVVCWTVLAAVAFFVTTACVAWELIASRLAARVEPLARTLRGAVAHVGDAAREAEAAGRVLEQHAARYRGVYEPLAGLAVACARDTLAASRTLTTQACLLDFVGGELDDLVAAGTAPACNVMAFEPRAGQAVEPEAEDLLSS